MRKSCFFAQISGGYGANCTDGWQGRSCLAKRMECVELAPAVGYVARFESGSKLHALHTLRAVWFRLCRPGDRRALPAMTDRLRVECPASSEGNRFEAALRRFDEENSRDPNTVEINGLKHPRERVYAEWLTDWVLRLSPEASEELRLAARCQHLCRWMIPRDSYPMTRVGYLKWREALKNFHAQKAGDVLRELGYPDTIIARVQSLNLKKNFP